MWCDEDITMYAYYYSPHTFTKQHNSLKKLIHFSFTFTQQTCITQDNFFSPLFKSLRNSSCKHESTINTAYFFMIFYNIFLLYKVSVLLCEKCEASWVQLWLDWQIIKILCFAFKILLKCNTTCFTLSFFTHLFHCI